MSEPEIERIAIGSGVAISRLKVDGGWLYITRSVTQTSYGGGPQPVAISTTFVPEVYRASSRLEGALAQ